MHAMAFGMPGVWELIIIGVILLLMIGAPLAVVLIVLLAQRGKRGPGSGAGNLTPCPDCGRPLSPLAEMCPECGRPMKPAEL